MWKCGEETEGEEERGPSGGWSVVKRMELLVGEGQSLRHTEEREEL